MVRIHFLAALLLLVLPFPLFGQSRTEDFDRIFLRALEMQKAGDLIGAIDAYKTALSIDATRVDALSNLGAAYVQLGQFDDAIAQYDAALTIDPSNATVRLNLALAYYKSGRPNEAIQPLKIVVATSPEARNAYLILADCYLQTGQYPDAVTLLQPREAMFEGDLGIRLRARDRTRSDRRRCHGQQYIDRIFKTRRFRRRTPPDGDRPSQQVRLPRGEERARTRASAQPDPAHGEQRVRTRSARAR